MVNFALVSLVPLVGIAHASLVPFIPPGLASVELDPASTTCTVPIPSSSYISEIPSWQSQNFSCPGPPQPWIMKSSPGKGMGLFAARTLEPGDIILQEAPIIRITPPAFRDGVGYPLNDIETLIRAQFDALSKKDRAEVLSLHAHMKDGEKRVDNLVPIFRSNAYNMESDKGTDIGLFLKGARINHSCRPNSSQLWIERLGKRVVYAIRRIEEGEEIFATYIPLLQTHEWRQQRLAQYGFKCSCSACTHSPSEQQASDKRRTDIQKAFAAFAPQLTLSVPQSAAGRKKAEKNAKASVQLAELVEEEALADYYAQAYRIAAICHARVEQWKPATMWAHKSYELRVMADEKSPATLEMHALTARFIENWNDDLRNKSMGRG